MERVPFVRDSCFFMDIYQASAIGVFRTILIVVFIIVVLRFVGKVLRARRNIQEQHNANAQKHAVRKAQEESRKNKGKITIQNGHQNAEDVDYEEV